MQEKERFGVEPPCHRCRRPLWNPANYLAWRIYCLLATQFCHDFRTDVFQVMDLFGVRNKARMLEKLSLIYQCQRANQERLHGD